MSHHSKLIMLDERKVKADHPKIFEALDTEVFNPITTHCPKWFFEGAVVDLQDAIYDFLRERKILPHTEIKNFVENINNYIIGKKPIPHALTVQEILLEEEEEESE